MSGGSYVVGIYPLFRGVCGLLGIGLCHQGRGYTACLPL